VNVEAEFKTPVVACIKPPAVNLIPTVDIHEPQYMRPVKIHESSRRLSASLIRLGLKIKR